MRGRAMPPGQLRRVGSPGAAARKLTAVAQRGLMGSLLGELRAGSRSNQQKCKQYLKPNYREAVGDSRKTTIPGTFITSTLQKLYVPQIAGNPLGYHSDPEHRHAAIIDQSKASSSSTPTAILPPHQTFYNAVLNFPTTLARTHASDFAPWGTNPTLELAFTKLSLGQPGSEQMGPQELMQNNSAMGLPSQRQARSVQLTPPRLMQNREVDIKGKGPAPEVDEQKLLVHVAAVMADGTTGAAGLLIKKGTGRFLCASYFPMRVTQPVLLAAACCEGIKIAGAYQPSTIVVESHQFHLLTGADAPCLHKEELLKLLDLPRCTMRSITEECNSTACQLASRCLRDGLARISFGTLPDFFVLT